MFHFHALILFINANPSIDPNISQITFIFSDDLNNPTFSFGFASKGLFEDIHHGEFVYVSGLTTNDSIFFDDLIVAEESEVNNYE